MSSDKELMFYYKLKLLRKLEQDQDKPKLAEKKNQNSEILFYNKLILLRKLAQEEQQMMEQKELDEEEKQKYRAQQFYIKIKGHLKRV
jgi:hypothetical protein